MITPKELLQSGVCRDMDTELFTGDDEVAHQVAKKICELKCPVKNECLEYAFETKQSWGVWGGTTAADRKNLLKIKHRVRCPGCKSTHVEEAFHCEICLSCGLTWLV